MVRGAGGEGEDVVGLAVRVPSAGGDGVGGRRPGPVAAVSLAVRLAAPVDGDRGGVPVDVAGDAGGEAWSSGAAKARVALLAATVRVAGVTVMLAVDALARVVDAVRGGEGGGDRDRGGSRLEVPRQPGCIGEAARRCWRWP